MFTLELLNVVKQTDSEIKRDALIELGYKLVETEEVETVGETTTPTVESELDTMTLTELKDYAAENGIDIKGLTAKADILEAVKG